MTSQVDEGTGYFAVDCRRYARQLSVLYSALTLECLAKQPARVLVSARHAAQGDPADHLALRDALTVLVMSGLPAGFRLAVVADALGLRRAFLALAHDLKQLGVNAAVCEDETEAWEWLGSKRPAAHVAAATAHGATR